MSTVIEQKPMKRVNPKTKSLTKAPFHYCPGCTHGIVHRLIAEVMDELDIRDKTIGIAPVGCAVFAYEYFNCDMQEAAHGRAPAVATGIKRALKDRIVFTYQGDGDLASIGIGEAIHAAARNENITIIFINNATYGMTGGQMAPTTLVGQVTATSPDGRNAKTAGFPLKIAEIMGQIEGVRYVARTSMHDVPNIGKTKAAIKHAFTNQVEGVGFSLVEILSTCPTNWGMSPVESLQWIKEVMIPVFPLGVMRDVTKEDGYGS